jgi:hypothetical protein
VPINDGRGTLALGAAFGPNQDTGFAAVNEYRIWYARDPGSVTAIAPAEQWRREPAPMQRWRVSLDDPAIALSLG